MATTAVRPPPMRQNQSYEYNQANTKQAQLATAYQQLARELASDQLKVVGGYTLGKVIGEGTFGSVHIASHRTTGTRCAIKKIPKSATPQLTREIHHHRRLHHPHIVHLHEIIATESHIWLVSELCSGGELFDYLVERGRLLEGEARRLFGELCTAVGWLHKQGVVHRDLKLENVLLDGELRVKLGDLGFAREYNKGRMMETFCGTTGYASPEMLACKKYMGVETDIWSLGIILYTLLCGGLPFDDDDERVMKDLIQKGEYEEPDWLTEDAKSLIAGMLHQDPVERFTMDQILTHPWFKKTLYDSLQGAASTDDPRSVPPSPLPGQTFAESYKPIPSSSSATSFPFSPRSASAAATSRPQPPSTLGPIASPDPESEPSETSFEFTDTQRKPSSGDTSPTTAENEDEPDIKRTHSGDLFSHTERALELAHQNSSESTIRDMTAEPSSLRARISQRFSLLSPKDEYESEGTSRADKRLSGASLTVIDEHAIPLPLAESSRTPVRTKRRSLTSQLPLERRTSHHSVSSQWQVYVPDDYLSQLNAERPPLFSTASEKVLLNRLSDVGFDTGQLIHSVMNNACDSSSALWWILRLKQMERGETDDVVHARQESAARRRERAEKRARARREGGAENRSPERPQEQAAGPANGGPTLTISSVPESRNTPSALRSKTPEPDHPITSTSTLNAPQAQQQGRSPPISPRGARSPLTQELSPSKDIRKTRSGSMNMLQRATSVLVGGVKKQPEREERSMSEPPEQQAVKTSPAKTPKMLPTKMTKSESDPSLLDNAGPAPTSRSVDTSPTRTQFPTSNVQQVADPLGLTDPSAAKAPKKDSIWTTFRHLFYEDKKRRRRDTMVPTKPLPVIPTRASNVRGGAITRTSMLPPPASRRTSFDGRPLYSHRSSSVNSRRSSIASNTVGDYTINIHDVGLQYGINRRLSNRSARSHRSGGSQTPTSDREHASRPGSSLSLQRGGSRRSSIRSPGNASDRFRGAPPSPLHDYHRRAASGSSSTRVRHIKVLHEAKALRPSSVASSIRSNNSSRASSFDLTRAEFDSDYDTGREDTSSMRSSSRGFDDRSTIAHLHNLALNAQSRTRSPLARGLGRKMPLRDVFQKKHNDDWESEDEDGTFAGGLGQTKGGNFGTQAVGHAAQHPSASRFNSSVPKRGSTGMGMKALGLGLAAGAFNRGDDGSGGGSSSKKSGESSSGGGSGGGGSSSGSSSGGGGPRGRRGGLPAARNQAPVIEEEEEEEE